MGSLITHTYIVGQTQSGKSVVAKRLADRVQRSGRGVIVHDPTSPTQGYGVAGWGKQAYVLNSFEAFAKVFWLSRGCLCIIDEAGDVYKGEHDTEARRMLTRGRHLDPSTGGGLHTVVIIAQRQALINKSARLQCSALFTFSATLSDAKSLSEDWQVNGFTDPKSPLFLPKLPHLHYVTMQRGGVPRVGVLRF